MRTEGERFAGAIAAQDLAGLRAVLAAEVDFAALTPARHWIATDRRQVEEVILGKWFAPDRHVRQLCWVTTGQVGDCRHVSYRLHVDKDGAEHIVEQQAYYTTHNGKIDWIRVICSGYRPMPL
jgi:hypothetical protein